MVIICFIIILWYSGLFFQTFFLHRYAAHQTYYMSPRAEKICYILTWITQGSNYLSAYGYGVMHRMHHAFADTEKDPHSPQYDENIFKMMWRTKEIYSQINSGNFPLDPKFTKNVPQWEKFDRFASSWPSRIAWAALYTLFFIRFATEWWQWLLLPVAYFMAPIHGAIINWFAHIYGYTNFKVSDTSKNLLPFDFLMMGEAYHNNHHRYGSRANFGFKWHEIDPTFLIMKGFDFIGLIRLRGISQVDL